MEEQDTFYSIIFASIAVSFLFIFFIFNLLFSDFSILNNTAYTQYNITQLSDMGFFDNERYLISALVQSLAATIALVITLSLVAVQLAAQSYSARVIDVYKTTNAATRKWLLSQSGNGYGNETSLK